MNDLQNHVFQLGLSHCCGTAAIEPTPDLERMSGQAVLCLKAARNENSKRKYRCESSIWQYIWCYTGFCWLLRMSDRSIHARFNIGRKKTLTALTALASICSLEAPADPRRYNLLWWTPCSHVAVLLLEGKWIGVPCGKSQHAPRYAWDPTLKTSTIQNERNYRDTRHQKH